MTRTRLAMLVMLCSCRFETLLDVPIQAEPDLPYPYSLHLEPHAVDDDELGQGWRATLRQHLVFLTGDVAAGRRPGTAGAKMTQQRIVATFIDAGLTPDGMQNWTQDVPLAVVLPPKVRLEVVLPSDKPGDGDQDSETDEASDDTGDTDRTELGPAASKSPAAKATPPATIAIDEGFYVRHTGAPYEAELSLIGAPFDRLCNLEGEQPPPDTCVRADGKLVFGRVPATDTAQAWIDAAAARFENARAARAAGCLIALPEDPDIAEAVRIDWQRPVIERRLTSRLPKVMPLSGYADPTVFKTLKIARDGGATVRVELSSERTELDDTNIVGRVPGAQDPRHVVLVTSHWDAGGFAPPEEGGSLVSNGTGVAVLLAAAEVSGRWYALGRRPRRSIVFAATAAGSLGNLGTPELLEIPGLGEDNVVAMINLDTLDWRGPSLAAVDGARSTMITIASRLGVNLTVLGGEQLGHIPFLDRGVPALTLTRFSGQPDAPVDPRTNLDVLARDADSVFRLVWELAEREEVPSLLPATLDGESLGD